MITLKKTLTIIFVAALILNIVAVVMVVGVVKEWKQQKQNRQLASDSTANSVQTQTTEDNSPVITASSQDANVGLWGGKWDDQWPVFLSIQTNAEPNTYKIRYRWLENANDARLSVRNLTGHKTNNYVQADFLTFRMTVTNGVLYGDFKTPRMANLVRLDSSSSPSPDNADELLRNHGWSENAIPADEAFKKITEEP